MDQHKPPAEPTDAEIDEVLAEFGGDAREAIAALLRDLATLAGDYEGSISKGYVRCGLPNGPYGAALVKRSLPEKGKAAEGLLPAKGDLIGRQFVVGTYVLG